MVQDYWGDEFSVPLRKGDRISKFTLVLLNILQSSAGVSVEGFRRSEDVKFLLEGQREDSDDQLCGGKVIRNADYFLAHLWLLLRDGLLKEGSIPESFGKLLLDLTALYAEPHWPAAEHALFALCRFAVSDHLAQF